MNKNRILHSNFDILYFENGAPKLKMTMEIPVTNDLTC